MAYVNDLVLSGNYLNEIQYVARILNFTFRIKDLDPLKGIPWTRHDQIRSWSCSYTKYYATELLVGATLLGCKFV